MKLNHLNLVVDQVPQVVHLMETYFSFKCLETKGENAIAILQGADGFSLVLMKHGTPELIYPKAFHIGFMLDNIALVDELHNRLLSGGIAVGDGPRKIRGSYGFYFNFDAFMIEVGVQISEAD
ncbi:MAG TPA: VOC family protein [Arachidicoccus sp.]|nr:VOC family protein [Arachidicoccus sp.]